MNREELIARAADEINVASVGQALAQEDYEKFDEKIDGLLANLSSRGIVYIGDADAIPDSIADQMAILLGDVCSKAFGKPRDFALRDRIEEEIRVIVRRKPATNRYLRTDVPSPGSGYTYSRWQNGD